MENTSDTPQNLLSDSIRQDCRDYEPTPDAQIVEAYYRYVDHGSVPGHDVSDWLETEDWLVKYSCLDRRTPARNSAS